MSNTITYAATAKCPCGAKLAYDATCVMQPFKIPSYWDCSAILLGTADPKVQHTAQLPFSFWEIKSCEEEDDCTCGSCTICVAPWDVIHDD